MEKKSASVMTFGAHRDVSKIINNKKEKRIQVLVDEDFHRNFKIACSKLDTNMTDVTLELLHNWLNEHKA